MGGLFSIGYATKDVKKYIDLLKKHSVNCLVDVRSSPYSHQFPDYNRENIAEVLKENGIKYLFFGVEFGARREEDEAYSSLKSFDGTSKEFVDFEKVWGLKSFKSGAERIINGLNGGYNICFMCSEKYPYDCHRCIMVSEYFYRLGHEITHIVDAGEDLLHSRLFEADAVRKYFDKCKGVFEKKYSNDLAYAFDLFTGMAKTVPQEVEEWEGFFAEETKEKTMRLLNLKIGYERGGSDNV